MCVICYKARGKKLPSDETIRNMWATNPDGAGVMWKRSDGLVDFRKGFMKLDDFLDFVKQNHDLLEGTECAMHFRIGTHGGNTPGNTHPFIVSMDEEDKHSLVGSGQELVLMHNGILPCTPRRKDLSDTAELALRAGGYEPPVAFLRSVDDMIGSNKVVLFNKDGDAEFFGGKWQVGEDGLLYSNLNHEGFSRRWMGFGGVYDWDAYGDGRIVGVAKPTAPDKSEKKKKGDKKGKDEEDIEWLTAWDVELPPCLNLGLTDTEDLAREVVQEVALEVWGSDLMTEEEWSCFFATYADVLEDRFFELWDDERKPAGVASAGQ